MSVQVNVTAARKILLDRTEVETRVTAPVEFSKKGATGERVTQLQRALQALGHLKTAPTGRFDAVTEAALKAFQTKAGMSPHGLYGPEARKALRSALVTDFAKRGPTLTLGERGRAVLQLERRLAAKGLLSGKADARFDDATKRAVQKLEKKLGQKQDGVVTARLWKALGGTGGGSGPSLAKGASGAAVKVLQRALQERGTYKGAINGEFGDQTRKALAAFERRRNLTADGKTDAAVWNELGIHVTARTVTGGPALRSGSTGAAVRTLQAKLKKAGAYDGPVDGKFGDQTAAAVKALQRKRGMNDTGRVGNAVWVALGGAGLGSGPVLKVGSSGAAVSVLQRRLKAMGLYNGPVDGAFGPATRAATVAAEKKLGLTADGVVTNKTWQAMKLHVVGAPTRLGDAAKLSEPAHNYKRVRAASGQILNVRTQNMLRRAETFAKQMGVRVPVWVTQGSYTSAVSASGGTHDRGGALDISTSGRSVAEVQKLVKAMRMAGFAAWKRGFGDDTFTPHIHAIAIGDRELASSARSQVAEYFRGGDGLVGSAGDGDSEVGRPWPKWANKYR